MPAWTTTSRWNSHQTWCVDSSFSTPCLFPMSFVSIFPGVSTHLLRWTTSELWYSSGGKRGDYQNCSVLDCVLKLCTVASTLRWAVLTVLWIGFCHTRPIPLCVDLFVFICVYFVCFCFILHSCCIIVSMVGWTWWDWSLILRTLSSFSAFTPLVTSFDS